MTALTFTAEELLAEHAYATPHVVAGKRLQGGFDEAGVYLSPRSLNRGPALDAWAAQLSSRHEPLFPIDPRLSQSSRGPNGAQHVFLLEHGIHDVLWNQLTQLVQVEARAKSIAYMDMPHLQDIIVDDISCMAIGHLHKGLLMAHGLDEGGNPELGLNGHDVLWALVRDLIFAHQSFEEDSMPRPEGRARYLQRHLPEIPFRHENLMFYLMNTFLYEVRASLGFPGSLALMSQPGLLPGAWEDVQLARTLVERVCQDEAPHLLSLRLYFSEMRAVSFKGTAGGTVPGHVLVDRLWEKVITGFLQDRLPHTIASQFAFCETVIQRRPDGAQLLAAFNALAQEPSSLQ
ncbi:MAG: hypothetical protein QM749_14015 [Aquabacterium sp.]